LTRASNRGKIDVKIHPSKLYSIQRDGSRAKAFVGTILWELNGYNKGLKDLEGRGQLFIPREVNPLYGADRVCGAIESGKDTTCDRQKRFRPLVNPSIGQSHSRA